MIKSAKQRRFLEATEQQRGYTGTPGMVAPAPSSPAIKPQLNTAPLTMPGGAVQSGGYLGPSKFKKTSMLPMRKVR